MDICTLNQLKQNINSFVKDNIIIGATGHVNIEKALNIPPIDKNLNKYDSNLSKNFYNKLDTFFNCLNTDKKITFISGMARGWDEIIALYAIKNNFNLILAIPHKISWHKNRTKLPRVQAIYYDFILKYDKAIIFEISKKYKNESFKYANFARNQFIVDKSDFILAFKGYSSPGTNDLINRAKKSNKCIYNFFNFYKNNFKQYSLPIDK